MTGDDSVETVRLNGSNDLLTAIPYLLGYHPQTSLVIVGVAERQIVLTARIDLDDPHMASSVWSRLTRPLHAAGARAFAVIGYTDDSRTPFLTDVIDAAPLPVVEALRVHEGHWWTVICAEPDCTRDACTPQGAPLITRLAVSAPFIADGSGEPGTRADLTRCLTPGPPDLLAAVDTLLPMAHVPARAVLLDAVTLAHQARTGGPRPVSVAQAALLLQALADVRVRDTCCALADDAAWWLWLDLIYATPPRWVAPVATLIAVTAYQRGDGPMAAAATEHALNADAGYALAQLIDACLRAAYPPRVIRRIVTRAIEEMADHDG